MDDSNIIASGSIAGPRQRDRAQHQRALTSSETAEIIGITNETLCRWRGKGLGPNYTKCGGTVRYLFSEIERWLGGNQPKQQAAE
jgi:hypothetical protein